MFLYRVAEDVKLKQVSGAAKHERQGRLKQVLHPCGLQRAGVPVDVSTKGDAVGIRRTHFACNHTSSNAHKKVEPHDVLDTHACAPLRRAEQKTPFPKFAGPLAQGRVG